MSDIAKAYDDYLVSIQTGMAYDEAIERACDMYGPTEKELKAYIKVWEGFEFT